MSRRIGSVVLGLCVVIIGLVSPLAAAASGSETWPSPPPASPVADMRGGTATLLIYSGVPDPTWGLSVEQLEELESLVAGLPETGTAPLEGGLGYRGFIVETLAGSLTAHLGTIELVQEGVSAYLLDPDRLVERFLLETGRAGLDPVEVAAVEASLGTPLGTAEPSP